MAAGIIALSLVVCLGSLSAAYPFYPHPELEYRTDWIDSHQGPLHLVYGGEEEPLEFHPRSSILEDPMLEAALNKPIKIVTDDDELALDEEELSKDDSGPTSLKEIEVAMKDDDEDEDDDLEEEDEKDDDDDDDELPVAKQREQRYLLAGSSGINDSYGWYGWPGSHGGRYHRHHASHQQHHGHMPTYHHGFYTAYYK